MLGPPWDGLTPTAWAAIGARFVAIPEGRACIDVSAAPGEQPGRTDITPDQTWLVGRIRPDRQGAHPREGRALEPSGQDLRVAPDEFPVASRRPDDPTSRHAMRALATCRDRERLRLGQPSAGGASGGTKVADRVPTLHSP